MHSLFGLQENYSCAKARSPRGKRFYSHLGDRWKLKPMILTGRGSIHKQLGQNSILLVRNGRYSDAANAFSHAESWQDLAYILERLLTIEELLEWVETYPSPSSDAEYARTDHQQVNALIARRLMREGKFHQALIFSTRHTETKLKRISMPCVLHTIHRAKPNNARSIFGPPPRLCATPASTCLQSNSLPTTHGGMAIRVTSRISQMFDPDRPTISKLPI